MITTLRKRNGVKVTKTQYVAEAIARANQQFHTAWTEYLPQAKAALAAARHFDKKLIEATQFN